jgi:hypothetical protein
MESVNNMAAKKHRYVHIDLGQFPKKCYKCGLPIGFYQLKSGKWIAVSAFQTEFNTYEIIVNRGNYGNYTPMHRC